MIDFTTLNSYYAFDDTTKYSDVGTVLTVSGVPKGQYFIAGSFVAYFKYSGGSNINITAIGNSNYVFSNHGHGYEGDTQVITGFGIANLTQDTNTITLSINGQSGTGDQASSFTLCAFRVK